MKTSHFAIVGTVVIILFLVIVYALYEAGSPDKSTTDIQSCTYGGGLRQAVKNNIIYREDIKKDYKVCMSGNSNRDVVYNDTNELAKTCLESAHKLNGGIVANDFSGVPTSKIGNIEKSLRQCGEIK